MYNIDFENAILSSFLYQQEENIRYLNVLEDSDFANVANREIFKVLKELYAKEERFEIEIINEKTDEKFKEHLLEILTTNPVVNVKSYIEKLKKYTLKRNILKLARSINENLQQENDPLTIIAKIKTDLEKLESEKEIKTFDFKDIDEVENEETKFILTNWLPFPEKTVSIITAPGGTGKSWLVLQLAIRFLKENKNKKAFLWLSEDPIELTKHRFLKICNEIVFINPNELKGRLKISSEQTIQVVEEKGKNIEINPLLYSLKSTLKEYSLIIFDPLIAFFGADENSNSQARRFMQLFTDWAAKEDKTIIFIHHSTKNTTHSRGASAFVDAVRLVYEIDFIKDDNKSTENCNRKIKMTKDNYNAKRFLDSKEVVRQIFPNVIEKVKHKKSKETSGLLHMMASDGSIIILDDSIEEETKEIKDKFKELQQKGYDFE